MAEGPSTQNETPLCEVGKQVPCKLCGSSTSLNIDTIHQLENIPVHYFCLLFSSGLGQRGSEAEGIKGFLAIDVKREIKRGSRLKCTYCRKKGATVGCAEPRCKKTYHLHCGSAHHSLQQYYDQFKSFCKEHRPAQKTRKPNQEEKSGKSDHNQCAVCRERIIRKATAKTLWSPCCGGFQHRNCVQALAVSAGRERFRCPVCNDNSEFQDEMRFYGIYVPEQEQDANTAREASVQLDEMEQDGGRLYQPFTPRLCHAKLCFCDQLDGRSVHSEQGMWKILQCQVCGSRGIHAKCGGLEDSENPIWNCYICRAVLRERGEEPVTIPASDDRWKSPAIGAVRVAEKSHDSPLDTQSGKSDKSFNMPSERSRDASNNMFKALLASLPVVESGESSHPSLPITPQSHPITPQSHPNLPITPQSHPSLPITPQSHPSLPITPQSHPITPQAKSSPHKQIEYKVTITPVIKSQKRRILSSKGPTVSSRPLWPSRKSTGSTRSATIGKPVGSQRSFINAQTGSLINVANGIQTGLPKSATNEMQRSSIIPPPRSNCHSLGGSVPAVLTLHTNSNVSSTVESFSTASSHAQLSSPTVLSVPRVITHSKLSQNQEIRQNGATNGINLSVPVNRKNMVEIQKIDLTDNKFMVQNKQWEATQRSEINCQKITSRTSLTDLITPILDAGPSHAVNDHIRHLNSTAIPTYGQMPTSRHSDSGQMPTSRHSQSIEEYQHNKQRVGSLNASGGTLSTSGGTSFADLVTPILDSNNHLQVNLKKDHFAVSDEHEVSPGDSDYESSYEMKGAGPAGTRECVEAAGDAAKVCMEKRNNIVTITKHKKIVLSKNEYDRNEGQLRVTDFYPNKRK